MTVTSRRDLFGVDPAEFVAVRDELARQLKADGERDEAAAVKALRRPSVPVWALNRVARDNGDAIDALLTAADDAREAQDALLAGDVDREALRAALAQRRVALHDVVRRAVALIEGSGRPAGSQPRQVESALNTVVASDVLSELLRNGELVEVVDDEADDDLASMLGASVAPNATKEMRPVSNLSDARAAKQAAAARKEVERLRKAASAAADALDKARRSVTEADGELEAARATLSRAEANAEAAHEAEQTAERVNDESIAALEHAEEVVRSGEGGD